MDWKEKSMTQEAKVEQLERRVQNYMLTARDKQFMDYLQKMQVRLKTQKHQVGILEVELNRSYQMYINRMKAAGIDVQVEEMEEPVACDVKEAAQIIENEQAVQPEKAHVEAVQPVKTQPSPNVQYVSAPYQAVKKNNSSTEFVVGSILLSIVGGAFILMALVMLGMYYMNGFVKGMCFYAGSLILMAVSELVLYKKWPKLGMTFTAISMGGLYLSTILNYLTYRNFNMWVALAIALIITIMIIRLSWKRDSVLYRALGLITSYLCILILRDAISDTELIVAAIITLFISIMCIVIPVQRHKAGFRILHMYANGIFSFVVCFLLYDYSDNYVSRLLFAGFAWLITHLLLVIQIRDSKVEQSNNHEIPNCGILIGYYISGVLIHASLPEGAADMSLYNGMLHFGSFVVMLIIAAVAMIFLRKRNEIRCPYFLMTYVAFNMFFLFGTEWESIISIVVLLLISKVVSAIFKVTSLRVWDVILTALTCLVCLAYVDESIEYALVLVAGVLISIPFISYWQFYYEMILTFTLAFFAAIKLPTLLQLPAFVGIMFVGILIFNNVKRWKGKYILIFNGTALAGQVVAYLLLINPIYRNAYIVYFCMLIFGLATIVLTFQEKYQMDFKGKNLILAIFLTYMALVIRTNLPIINSILIMLIALICVGIGFFIKNKSIRIYGLVLSLIVCGKIAIYDFFGAETLQKMILFFIVGVIALVISGIYIILERKTNIQRINSGEGQ